MTYSNMGEMGMGLRDMKGEEWRGGMKITGGAMEMEEGGNGDDQGGMVMEAEGN